MERLLQQELHVLSIESSLCYVVSLRATQNSICVIMLPKYSICMGYGHVLIYVVAYDKILLECTSLYVLHAVWCLFLSVLLQQVR